MKKNIHLHITCCFDNQSAYHVLSLLKIFGHAPDTIEVMFSVIYVDSSLL